MTEYKPAPAGYVVKPGDRVRVTETHTERVSDTRRIIDEHIFEGTVMEVDTRYDALIATFVGSSDLAYLADVPDEDVTVVVELAVDRVADLRKTLEAVKPYGGVPQYVADLSDDGWADAARIIRAAAALADSLD